MKKLLFWCAITCLPFLAVSGVGQEPPEAKADVLLGTWKVTNVESDGEKAPTDAIKDWRWVFEDKVVNWGKEQFSFTIDSTKSPKQIDLVALDGLKKGKTIRGIYTREDKTLTVCLRNEGEEADFRPKEFSGGEGLSLIVFKLMETDPAALQGRWEILTAEIDGKQIAEKRALVIRENAFSILEEKGDATKGTFEIDQAAKPESCEVAEGSNRFRGIYELTKDDLKICLGTDRPDEFKAGAGSGRILLTCRRVAKDSAAAAAKKDAAKLRGIWTLAFAIVDGNKSSDEKVQKERNQWKFQAERFTITRADQPGQVTAAAFTLDPTSNVPAVDIVPDAGPDKGKLCQGIYQLEEESLTLCIASPGFARPREFASTSECGCVLLVYKKNKDSGK